MQNSERRRAVYQPPSAEEISRLDTVFDALFPLARSITGPAYRHSLEILSPFIPLKPEMYPTGTQVLDWVVPEDWELISARLTGPDGVVYADAARCNLEVLNFSVPMHTEVSWDELQPHLFSQPEVPQAIPYVTSYYKKNWGFCVSQAVRETMPRGTYRVDIQARHESGGVVVGECRLPGLSRKEILLSSYLCHPSMGNNELSGPLALMMLYERLRQWPKRHYTYRFLINPETIGSICFLSRHGDSLKQSLLAGLVLTCLGGPAPTLRYKSTRRENHLLDRLMQHLSHHGQVPLGVSPFTPLGGSDERQYNSPGYNLPVGQVARTVYGEHAEYHTSLDTKEFMNIRQVAESAAHIEVILKNLEYAAGFINTSPYGELQLGRRGLYPTTSSVMHHKNSAGGLMDGREQLNQILMILNYSDAEHDGLWIAERMGRSLRDMIPSFDKLLNHEILNQREASP
jgi:aminopeptidase-like protein